MEGLLHQQELLRAQHVVEKARREGDNVADALRNHAVASSIAEQLIGESTAYVVKKRRGKSGDVILEWTRAHIGAQTCPADIAKATGLSYTTTNKFVNEHRNWYQKIKKGTYIVIDADAAREADKAVR